MTGIRPLLMALAALALAAGVSRAGKAADQQAARVDDRWQARLGCWQLLEEAVHDADDPYAAPEFVADGARHPVDEPGCTGWRRAQCAASSPG